MNGNGHSDPLTVREPSAGRELTLPARALFITYHNACDKRLMTGAQIRAGRALVGLTVRELAERSGVHRNTISNIEVGRYHGAPESLAAIRKALEAAGVRFIGEAGVKLR
jgi:DNA-binding XRE family transcriptional regulator